MQYSGHDLQSNKFISHKGCNVFYQNKKHSSFCLFLFVWAGYQAPYLIFVIFFTRVEFVENKIYTEKRQFFALNL